MSTSTFTVIGMTCDHCVASVTEEVSEVPDIETVHVELATGALTVTSTRPVPEGAVKAAVEDAGYRLA
jgi:copper chaperone